jgi:predicted enzyme related to lactoylglutathione lyase
MRFAKINVRVRDIESAIAYTCDVLGGEVISRPETPQFGEIALVRLHGLILELIQPLPGTWIADRIERRGEGVDSIAFVTDDILDAAKKLNERGAQVIAPAADNTEAPVWVYPKNPLSMSIELLPSSLFHY